jgi:hypothetical protein
MATWKRLTRTGGEGPPIDVNLDLVIHMQWFANHSNAILYFAVPDGEGVRSLHVRESPDQIHTTKQL